MKWLLSLLIPGAGFIKAIMAIKDIIVFFVESATVLIPAITEAILALARGDIKGVVLILPYLPEPYRENLSSVINLLWRRSLHNA